LPAPKFGTNVTVNNLIAPFGIASWVASSLKPSMKLLVCSTAGEAKKERGFTQLHQKEIFYQTFFKIALASSEKLLHQQFQNKLKLCQTGLR
jgi:hypothetical protein